MNYVAGAVVLITAASAAFFDVRTGRIPDSLTLGALGFGLGASCVFGPFAVISSIGAVGSVLLCAAYVDHSSFRLGGGDYKLMMAVGAILGIVGLVLAICGALILMHVWPPKISRPMAPIIFGAVVFSVTMKEVLGC